MCSVRVFDDYEYSYTEGILASYDHIVTKCVDSKLLCVVNESWRGPYDAVINKAVATAVDKGIVMVAAAGNDEDNACNYSPASNPTTITVGATDKKDKEASYSNYGSCVDVHAPGSEIKSAWSGSSTDTKTIDGTSMASPRKYFY